MNIVDLIYPKKTLCVGCGDKTGSEADWLCEKCKAELDDLWLGAMDLPEYEGAFFAYKYSGVVSKIVKKMKFTGWFALAENMSRDMLTAWENAGRPVFDAVVYVPIHKHRRRERGFNQAELLAKDLAKGIGAPIVDAIERVRDTPQQSRLSGEERRNNLKDAFKPTKLLDDMRVLLVDDVYTTGTTAWECAKTLKEAGAKAIWVAAYSKAVRED